MLLDNFDTRDHLLEVVDVFTEFTQFNYEEFSSEELMKAADTFVKVTKGKVSKEKVKEGPKVPTRHSLDTYTLMTNQPWLASGTFVHDDYSDSAYISNDAINIERFIQNRGV